MIEAAVFPLILEFQESSCMSWWRFWKDSWLWSLCHSIVCDLCYTRLLENIVNPQVAQCCPPKPPAPQPTVCYLTPVHSREQWHRWPAGHYWDSKPSRGSKTLVHPSVRAQVTPQNGEGRHSSSENSCSLLLNTVKNTVKKICWVESWQQLVLFSSSLLPFLPPSLFSHLQPCYTLPSQVSSLILWYILAFTQPRKIQALPSGNTHWYKSQVFPPAIPQRFTKGNCRLKPSDQHL